MLLLQSYASQLHHVPSLHVSEGPVSVRTHPSFKLLPGVKYSTILSATHLLRESDTITKLMVAFRGEITIHVFVAWMEMNIRTVTIYSEQDKMHMHRQNADESYLIGQGLPPEAAYINIPEIINIAKENGVDAIHQGYGFLSGKSDFAQAEVLRRMRDKDEAREEAIVAGVQVIPGTPSPVDSAEDTLEFYETYGLPVIFKAANWGGGRGIRIVKNMENIKENFHQETSEAQSFGKGALFLEKCLDRPRHIEVQILGDKEGDVVHQYERGCSAQRRHQKVVGITLAPQLAHKFQQAMMADAIKPAKHVGYENEGTVENSVDQVQSQIKVAVGKFPPKIGLTQGSIFLHECAIQCHMTTEDPVRGFQPDTGRIENSQHVEKMSFGKLGVIPFAPFFLEFGDCLTYRSNRVQPFASFLPAFGDCWTYCSNKVKAVYDHIYDTCHLQRHSKRTEEKKSAATSDIAGNREKNFTTINNRSKRNRIYKIDSIWLMSILTLALCIPGAASAGAVAAFTNHSGTQHGFSPTGPPATPQVTKSTSVAMPSTKPNGHQPNLSRKTGLLHQQQVNDRGNTIGKVAANTDGNCPVEVDEGSLVNLTWTTEERDQLLDTLINGTLTANYALLHQNAHLYPKIDKKMYASFLWENGTCQLTIYEVKYALTVLIYGSGIDSVKVNGRPVTICQNTSSVWLHLKGKEDHKQEEGGHDLEDEKNSSIGAWLGGFFWKLLLGIVIGMVILYFILKNNWCNSRKRLLNHDGDENLDVNQRLMRENPVTNGTSLENGGPHAHNTGETGRWGSFVESFPNCFK